MYGSANGGSTLPGHVFSLTYHSSTGSWSAPVDLTLDPVTNDSLVTGALNYYGLDISSIFIDPLDTTGRTVYVTVAGLTNPNENVQTVYGSTNGGASWEDLMANLPAAPANSVVVDPGSSSTVYVATDAGVYATQQLSSCVSGSCWEQLGSGLPNAPVVALSAQPASASEPNLIAATYGRGIWMTPLLGGSGAGSGPATDTLSTTSLSFPTTTDGQLSSAEYVTVTNSGSVALTSISVSVSGAFQQTDPCTATLAANSSCTISVQFAPTSPGAQSGALTIQDELQTQTVTLAGTGIAPPELAVSPASLSFAATVVQSTSTLPLTVTNGGGAPLAGVGFEISSQSPPASFSIGSTTCGATLTNVSGQNSCTVQVLFNPQAAGGATASLAVSDSSGVSAVTVPLTGTGLSTAGLNVNLSQLTFPVVAPGQSSPSQTVTITNNSPLAANGLTLTATSPFSLLANTCGSSLAAGAYCSTGVVFSPSLSGLYAGTLTIASTSLAASAGVSLSGLGGVPGAVQFQPSPLVFQQTGVGLTSSAIPVTIANPDGVNEPQRPDLRDLDGLPTGEQRLPLDACASGKLHSQRRICARQRRSAERQPHGEQQRVAGGLVPGSIGHGIQLFHGSFRLLRPDHRQRPNRRLHAHDQAAERLPGRFHLPVRNAASVLVLHLQSPQRGRDRQLHRQRSGGDRYRAHPDLGPGLAPIAVVRSSAGLRLDLRALRAEAPVQGLAADRPAGGSGGWRDQLRLLGRHRGRNRSSVRSRYYPGGNLLDSHHRDGQRRGPADHSHAHRRLRIRCERTRWWKNSPQAPSFSAGPRTGKSPAEKRYTLSSGSAGDARIGPFARPGWETSRE